MTGGKCAECGTLCTEKIEFLDGLPAEKQAAVVSRAVRQHFEKGSFLFREGEPVDSIYIIHGGRVKLSTSDTDGREQIVGIFSENDTIWEGVLISGSVYPYSGICVTPVDCCRISRRDFENALGDPVIAVRVIGHLSKKLHDANERNRLLSTADPVARLAGFLLYHSRRSAGDTLTFKLDDIAASINLRPETVSRKIGELERDGMIKKVAQSSIRLTDAPGLRKIFEA